MKSVVLAAVFICGCGGGSSANYETLLDEDFATYPFDWTWAGGGGPTADPNYGYPAPSAFVRGQAVSPSARFMFTNQGLDAKVTAFLESNMMFGEQYAVFRIDPDFEGTFFPRDGLALVAYRLVNNSATNTPITGFPAGQTAEIVCAFNGGAQTQVQVTYVEGAVAYDLYFTVDALGSHCGYDDTEVALDAPTFVTGTYRAVLGGTAAANAWFDNLVVRREL
jgi:hypothetical protein